MENSSGDYSVDQVISDTAAAQRQQTQDFFTTLANALGLQDPATPCDPSAFWCNYGMWVLLAGLGFGAYLMTAGGGRRYRR